MKIAYAVVNEHYLPYAYVTRESFLRHNSTYNFIIFLHGPVNDRTVIGGGIMVAEEFLGAEKSAKLNPSYSIFERSCALKTILGAEIISKYPECTRIVYLDSDLFFTDRLADSISNDNTSSIFLTPHTFKPILNKTYLNDLYILSSGVFNAGYFELNVTSESRDILDFLNTYMFTFCNSRKGLYPTLFVDQMFYDLIPIYFDNYRKIEHPGYNVSFHNLHERCLNKSVNGWEVDGGKRLIFFHFSGLNFTSDDRFSKYYDFDFISLYPDLASLRSEYAELLIKYNYKIVKTSSEYSNRVLNLISSIKNKLSI